MNIVKRSLGFMTRKERRTYFRFLALRAMVAFLDLIGIVAIGFLATSMALLLTQRSGTTPSIFIAGVSVPSVTAETLPVFSAIILTIFLTKALISILLTRQLAYFLAKIEARAARNIAQKSFGNGLQGARTNTREEILYAVQEGSPSAFNSILNSIGTLTAEGFLFVLVLTAFTIVNPSVALGAVIYFGIIGLLIQMFLGRLMQRTGVKLAESVVQANSGLSDLGEVVREASILGRQRFFYDRIFEARLKSAGNYATQYVLSGLPRYIVESALIVAIAVFVLVQAVSGDVTKSAATVGIFLTGGLRLTSSLLPLQSALLIIRQAIPSATRALDLIDSRDYSASSVPIKSTAQPKDKPLSVLISDLSFKYINADSNVITRVSLEIPAGSQAAFIGVSGAGKSTLADLTLGLLEPTSGRVLLGGIRPQELTSSYPGILGYVPQKPGMITGTIKENIAMGVNAQDLDQKRLTQAVKDAHLMDLIDSLPLGLDTDLGKRKDELSGGQLQRLGLARALYSQPKLLILDEATSALDADSENEINKALDEMRGKVTIILIAHRLNTIQRSDVVFLLEEGQVSASGTFNALLKDNETVKNLAKLMSIDALENPPQK